MSKPDHTTVFAGHEHVLQAHGIIKHQIRETGAERTHKLESGTGEVWLKLECQQVAGSFKVRGALHRLAALSDEERGRGIIACSAGNHGLGVAHAAEVFGVPATIFVPRTVDGARKEMLEGTSATVHVIGESYEECERKARQVSVELSKTFISPYNDPWVVAGQGTLAIELLQQIPNVELVLLAVGGGGLAAGVAAYLKAVNPSIKIVGVSPANSAGMYDLITGIPRDFVSHVETLSDSTAGGVEHGSITIDMCRALLDQWILVEEADISAAMRYLFYEHRLVVEGAGALALAGFLKERERIHHYNSALIVCGGNIDPKKFLKVVNMGE